MHHIFKLVLPCLLLVPAMARALTIDEMDGTMSVQCLPGQPAVRAVLPTAGAIGGTRSLEAKVTSGSAPSGANLLAETSFGEFSVSEDTGIAGYALLSWDGDLNFNSIQYNGLPGVDFTQDGATAIQIEVLSYDFPSSQPLTLRVQLYDATDATKKSEGTVVLTSFVNGLTTFSIPMISLVAAPGASGPASLLHVGAVTLRIDAENTPRADLELDWIGTNGQCRLVPDAQGKVIDICGVCGGDGTSCLDCAGVPFGTAQLDRCGVCGGDGSSCVTCSDTNVSDILATLDGGAKKLEKRIQEAARQLKKVRRDAATKRYIDKTLAEVHRLQISNWILSWTFPVVITTCDNEQVCTFAEYHSSADTYRAQNEQMRQIGLNLIRRWSAVGKIEAKKTKPYLKNIEKQAKANLEESYVVPVKNFSC